MARRVFRSGLANLVDQAVVSGAKQADVFETAIEEPANDWSAATP